MSLIFKLAKWLLLLATIGSLVGVSAAATLYFYLTPRLPAVDSLREVQLQVPLRVYTRDAELIAEYGDIRREPLPLEQIPQTLQEAFLAAEDDRFWEHPGVDYKGLLRAALNLALTGRRDQGGSTITMQVARNFFLTREKTYTRKLNEILLALKIERQLNKAEILELYLNKIPFGSRAHGVGAAAQIYYGRAPRDLTLAETAMIAGLPKAPSGNNPLINPERAVQRRNYVLGRMLDLEMIDLPAFEEAVQAGITAKSRLGEAPIEASYVGELARARAVELFGEEAYTQGLRVFTTLEGRLQTEANAALRKGLLDYEQRHGFRGAIAQLEPEELVALQAFVDQQSEPTPAYPITVDVEQSPAAISERVRNLLQSHASFGGLRTAVVYALSEDQVYLFDQDGELITLPFMGMSWAAQRQLNGSLGAKPSQPTDVLKAGDIVRVAAHPDGYHQLVQEPEVEGALVALRPDDGAVRALVGGFDFRRSQFNRVMQATRQPGSSFKPFIYAAALENGYTPASLINDAPVVFQDPALEDVWRPENYGRKFYGPTRFREALVKSRNLVSIRILLSLGVKPALKYVSRFGFPREQLPADLSLALGSGALTPMQLVTAYAVFANGGFAVEPYLIERIEAADGAELYRADPMIVCRECTLSAEASLNQTFLRDGYEYRAAPRVIDARVAYILRSMMQDVIKRGTGRRASALGRGDIAGKTGTTNDQRDAWFSGFTSEIVATAWAGYDDQLPLGDKETGSRAALPIWVDFMREALRHVPESKVVQPAGLVTIMVDRKTGKPSPNGGDVVFEIFREENVVALTDQASPRGSGERVSPVGPGADQESAEQLF